MHSELYKGIPIQHPVSPNPNKHKPGTQGNNEVKIPKELSDILRASHVCKGCLMRCCTKFMCETCYTLHLNQVHPKELGIAKKFYEASQLMTGTDKVSMKGETKKEKQHPSPVMYDWEKEFKLSAREAQDFLSGFLNRL